MVKWQIHFYLQYHITVVFQESVLSWFLRYFDKFANVINPIVGFFLVSISLLLLLAFFGFSLIS